MRKKIITHIGTHSTGKTTAVYSHAAFLKKTKPHLKIGIVDENARNCPFPIHQAQNVDTIFWLFTSQIKCELEAIIKNDIVISDRSVFDCIAYTHVASPHIHTDNLIQLALLHHYRHYNQIIYHPICGDQVCPDGFRNTDPDFRIRVDYAIRALLHIHSVPYVSASTGVDSNPWWEAVLEANASAWNHEPQLSSCIEPDPNND